MTTEGKFMTGPSDGRMRAMSRILYLRQVLGQEMAVFLE